MTNAKRLNISVNKEGLEIISRAKDEFRINNTSKLLILGLTKWLDSYKSSSDQIPFAENLTAYIEQRGQELESPFRENFVAQEITWTNGYLQALKDYNIYTPGKVERIRNGFKEIFQALLS